MARLVAPDDVGFDEQCGTWQMLGGMHGIIPPELKHKLKRFHEMHNELKGDMHKAGVAKTPLVPSVDPSVSEAQKKVDEQQQELLVDDHKEEKPKPDINMGPEVGARGDVKTSDQNQKRDRTRSPARG